MRNLRRWLVLTGMLGVGIGFARGEPAPVAPKPVDVVVRFHDGTTVRRVSIQDSVEIVTRYGKLSVPFADIRRIEFGLHSSEESTKKLDEALAGLVGNNFQKREKAGQDLFALGRLAYPSLLALAREKDKDPETKRRVEALLERIQEAIPEEELRTEAEDIIRTRKCVLAGRIQSPVLKAKAESLGELSMKLSELRSIHASSSEGSTSINTAKYGAADGQWMETNITVEADVDLLIVASGQIDINVPAQPGNFVCDPDGHPNLRSQTINAAVGTLIGRIGEKGEPFVIGKRYDGRPKQEGKLYLHVVSFPQQEGYKGPIGTYKVRVVSDPDWNVEGRRVSLPGQPGQPGVEAPPPVPKLIVPPVELPPMNIPPPKEEKN